MSLYGVSENFPDGWRDEALLELSEWHPDSFLAREQRKAKFIEAMREILARSRPAWWRVDQRVGLKKRREWVLTCINNDWPWWVNNAVNCGVDMDTLTAVSALIMEEPVKLHNPGR